MTRSIWRLRLMLGFRKNDVLFSDLMVKGFDELVDFVKSKGYVVENRND